MAQMNAASNSLDLFDLGIPDQVDQYAISLDANATTSLSTKAACVSKQYVALLCIMHLFMR